VISSLKIAPANSLLFVSDVDGGRPPEPIRGSQILTTDSCLSIACYPSIDGETEVTLGPSSEVNPGTAPAFDGELDTPSRRIGPARHLRCNAGQHLDTGRAICRRH